MRVIPIAFLILWASAFAVEAQNRIQNGQFNEGLDHWRSIVVGGGTVQHLPGFDAGGSSILASARFTIPAGPARHVAGLSQCVTFESVAFAESLRAEAWAANGCFDAVLVSDASWFASPDCGGGPPIRGDFLAEFKPQESQLERWIPLFAEIDPPPLNARSVAVNFFGSSVETGDSCEFRLDNVFLGTEENEPPPGGPDLAVSLNIEEPVQVRSGATLFTARLVVEITNVGDEESSGRVDLVIDGFSGTFLVEESEFGRVDDRIVRILPDLTIRPDQTVRIPLTVRVLLESESAEPFFASAVISSPEDSNTMNDRSEYELLFLSTRGEVLPSDQPTPRAVGGRSR